MKYRKFEISGIDDEYSLVSETGYVVCVMQHPDKKYRVRIGSYSEPITPQMLAKVTEDNSIWEFLGEGNYYEDEMSTRIGINDPHVIAHALTTFGTTDLEEDPTLFVVEQVMFGFDLY